MPDRVRHGAQWLLKICCCLLLALPHLCSSTAYFQHL